MEVSVVGRVSVLFGLLHATSVLAQVGVEQLQPYFGKYQGFAPVRLSALGIGEAEVTLNQVGLTERIATPNGEWMVHIPMQELLGHLKRFEKTTHALRPWVEAEEFFLDIRGILRRVHFVRVKPGAPNAIALTPTLSLDTGRLDRPGYGNAAYFSADQVRAGVMEQKFQSIASDHDMGVREARMSMPRLGSAPSQCELLAQTPTDVVIRDMP